MEVIGISTTTFAWHFFLEFHMTVYVDNDRAPLENLQGNQTEQLTYSSITVLVHSCI